MNKSILSIFFSYILYYTYNKKTITNYLRNKKLEELKLIDFFLSILYFSF